MILSKHKRGVRYFPIFDTDKWVATAVVSYNADREMNVQVSTEYVDTYTSVKASYPVNSNVALVFDDNSAYLYLNDTFILDYSSKSPDAEQLLFLEQIDISLPATANLTPDRYLRIANRLTVKEDSNVPASGKITIVNNLSTTLYFAAGFATYN